MIGRLWCGVSFLIAVTLTNARAEPARPVPRTPPPSAFSSVFNGGGLERLAQYLATEDESLRLLVYREIGFRGDLRSLELLTEHLENPNTSLTSQAALVVARVLSPMAKTQAGYRALLHHAFGVANLADPSDPKQRLALETSLLGIAATETERSLTDLCRALTYEGALAHAASNALLVYPPKPVTRLLRPSCKRSVALLRLLGRLRVIEAKNGLREQLLDGPLPLKLAAAAALLELEDPDVVRLAKRWATEPSTPSEFRELARSYRQKTAFTVDANFVAVSLDKDAPTLNLLRYFNGDAAALPPIEVLRRALEGSDALRRWQAAAILCKLSPEELTPHLDDHDPVIESALEWAIPYLPADSPLIKSLEHPTLLRRPRPTSINGYGFLAHSFYQERRSSTFLLGLANEDHPYAAFGAEGLAARLSPTLTEPLRRLLGSPKPWIRAATALGLGRARWPSATGILMNHYDVETEPVVRRALVFALNLRRSRLAKPVLEHASRFDPDELTRFLATSSAMSDPRNATGFDPFERALTTSLGSIRTTSPPNAYRLNVAQPASYVRVTGPLGRTLRVPLDPRGWLLIPGDVQWVTMALERETPTTTALEAAD